MNTPNTPELKIPPKARYILDSYLLSKSHQLPEEAVLLNLYMGVSRILCFNRVRLHFIGEDYRFPNIYVMIFMNSGLGKDETLSAVNKILKLVKQDHQKDLDEYVEKIKRSLDTLKRTKGVDGKKDKYGQYEKQALTEKYYPRDLHETTDDETPESLLSRREEFEKAGVGATHFTNGEFLDFLNTSDNSKKGLVSLLKKVYDRGASNPKGTKGNTSRGIKPIEDIPATMLVHSDITPLLGNDKLFDEFHASLGSGFSRRSIICSNPKEVGDGIPETEEAIRELVVEEIASLAKTDEKLEEIQHIFFNIHDRTKYRKKTAQETKNTCQGTDMCVQNGECFGVSPCAPLYEYKRIVTDPEVAIDIKVYEKQTGLLIKNNKSLSKNEKTHINTQAWRAHKLASIIAMLEHPEDPVIRKEDFLYAKNNVEFFAQQYKEILYTKTISDSQKMIQYILTYQDKQNNGLGVLYGDLKNVQFSPKNRSAKKTWVDETLLQIEEDLSLIDKEIVFQKIKNATYYRIEPTKKEPPVDNSTHMVRLSFTKSTVPHPTQGYTPVECKFSSLASNIKKGACYSPAFFKDGYRDTEHLDGHGNLVIIDVDDNMSLGEAIKTLDASSYSYLVVTTSRHQKQGKGDRYRVILPTTTDLAPKNGYSNLMINILKHLSFDTVADLGATKDQVRYYKPSPTDAVVHYSFHKKLIDWTRFDTKPTTKSSVPYTPPQTNTPYTPKNVIKDATFTDKTNRTYTWADFEHITEADTVPVRCIFPEKHAHGDKNPSAFIGRHATNKTLMFKCSACDSLVYQS